MIIAAGAALGAVVFLVTYIVFMLVSKSMLGASNKSDKAGEQFFFALCALLSALISIAGGIGLGLLTALSIIGV